MPGEEETFDSEEFAPKKSSSGFKFKLETIIPIIVIIGVILLIVFKTNVLSGGIPLFEGSGVSILVIGSPSPETVSVLNDAENKDVIKQWRLQNVEAIEYNPKERIKPYDIIILDQSMSSDKSISRTIGEALDAFVKSGGKLIVVLNSGIERTGSSDVIGWTATIGDIIPVTCDYGIYKVPTCKNTIRVDGFILANRSNSKQSGYKITYGIERVPALETAGLIQTETYKVGVVGNEIAYLVDARTGATYPAIIEKPLLLGKVIYFNYNPGKTKTLLINTIKYLK